MAWTVEDIPDQDGRVAVVTGANSGIGYEAAKALAHRGAHVILACRSPERGKQAVERLRDERPRGEVSLRPLDLADLDDVRRFADGVRADHPRLDLLIHNAGVMVPPFSRTKQGFELQFGTNHLGHFALGGHLLPALAASPGSRLVVVYSGVHTFGRVDFDDPNYERRPYRAAMAYAQSKLANVLYATELHRRLGGRGPAITAAHPGWTATDLQRTATAARWLNPLFAMKPADGALPTLRAATDPGARSGSFWGPSGWRELNGPPVPGRIAARGADLDVAARLWALSESATGVRYAWPDAVAA